MNIKIKYATFLLVALIGLTYSCSRVEDDSFFTEGGSVLFYENIENGFFDLGDLDNTFIAFDVDAGGDPISEVIITKTFSGAAGTFGPIEHVTGPLGNYNISLVDAISGFDFTPDDLAVGDAFTFTSTSGTATRDIVIPASCTSELAGTYAFETTNYFCDDAGPLTGMVTLTGSGGIYTIDDWSFGTYPQCYGGVAASWGGLMLNDLCNTISIVGSDSYGDAWTYTINEVSGADLTITYENTYGEFGTTVLTRADGTDWPPLKN